MSEFVKLTEPGSEVTLFVQQVALDKSGKWPDYHLSDGTKTVVVPKAAADRQITERLKLSSVMALRGGWVRVSRTEKLAANGNPYWDLKIVPAPAAESQAGRVPSPYSHGDLPGEDEIPEAVPAAVPEADDEVPVVGAKVERGQFSVEDGARREKVLTLYAAVYETMLRELLRIHTGTPVAVTAEAVQAATATVIIQYAKGGLL